MGITSTDIQTIQSVMARNDIAFAGIFGSRARGDNGPDSDLDLLIEFKHDAKSLLELIGMENELSDKLGIKVDLVTEQALSPYIKDSVLGGLQIIYGQR